MLLSFERPASPPALVDLGPRALAARARLFSDLENCTVANDTGIKAKRLAAFCLGEIEDFSEGKLVRVSPVTVKILRAHGGCLGTKSR